MARRNQILSNIHSVEDINTVARSLLNVLEKERRIINIILSEDELERRNIDIAIDTLFKVRKEPAIIDELKRRNIDFEKLREAAGIGLTILKGMAKRLKHIIRRIELKEALISNPTSQNFKNYLKQWGRDIVL